MGRRLALLIATYQYHDAGLRQLTAPAHDAETLAAVPETGPWAPQLATCLLTTLALPPPTRC